MIYNNTFFSDGTISPMRISPDHMNVETRAIRTGNKLFSIFKDNKVIIGGIERDLVIKHMPDDIGGMSFFYFIRSPEGEKELIVPEDTTEDARIMREAMDRIRHEPPILF